MFRVFRAAGAFAGAGVWLLATSVATAQTSPLQGTNLDPAAAHYLPTSLAPDAMFSVPRTRDGVPDFNGVVWAANFFALLEAAPGMMPPELVLSEEKGKQAYDRLIATFFGNPMMKKMLELDPEAGALIEHMEGLPIVRGERRTRLVVLPADGRLPYTPEGRKAAAAGSGAMMSAKADNPEERTPAERCIELGGQPPMAMMSALHPRRFIQTTSHILIQTEYGDELRIIPFADKPQPAPRSAMGSSFARWDGDTLVIETTGFPAEGSRRGAFPTGLVIGADARVTERFTRVGPDELLYQFTVEDPQTWTAPWLAEYSLFRAPYGMYPSSCHEGNYALANILSAQRAVDTAARRSASSTSRE